MCLIHSISSDLFGLEFFGDLFISIEFIVLVSFSFNFLELWYACVPLSNSCLPFWLRLLPYFRVHVRATAGPRLFTSYKQRQGSKWIDYSRKSWYFKRFHARNLWKCGKIYCAQKLFCLIWCNKNPWWSPLKCLSFPPLGSWDDRLFPAYPRWGCRNIPTYQT